MYITIVQYVVLEDRSVDCIIIKQSILSYPYLFKFDLFCVMVAIFLFVKCLLLKVSPKLTSDPFLYTGVLKTIHSTSKKAYLLVLLQLIRIHIPESPKIFLDQPHFP